MPMCSSEAIKGPYVSREPLLASSDWCWRCGSPPRGKLQTASASVLGPEPLSPLSPSWNEGCSDRVEICVISLFRFPLSKQDFLGMLWPCPPHKAKVKQHVPKLLSPSGAENWGVLVSSSKW